MFFNIYLSSYDSLLLRRKPHSAQDSVDVKIIDFGLSKVRSRGLFREILSTPNRYWIVLMAKGSRLIIVFALFFVFFAVDLISV